MWETIRHFYHEIPEWLRVITWTLFSIAISFAMVISYIDKIKPLFHKKKEDKPKEQTTTTETDSHNIEKSPGGVSVDIHGTVSGNITITSGGNTTNSNPKKEEENENSEVPTKKQFVKTSGIFGLINKIRKYEFKKLNFSDNRKNELFIKFMSIFINSLEKHLLRIEDIEDMNKMPIDEFNNIIMNIIFDYIGEVNQEMKNNFKQETIEMISESQFNKTINELMILEMESYLKERNHHESNEVALLQCLSTIHLKIKLLFNKNYEKYTHLNGILDKIFEIEYENPNKD